MKTPGFLSARELPAFFCLGVALACGTAAVSPARAQSEMAVSGDPLNLQVGEGKLISLPRPANTIFVSDPTIADVQVKTPQLFFVYGKKLGTASIYAIDAQRQMIMGRPVSVTLDLTALQKGLTELYPNGGVHVEAVNGSVVLTGTVATPGDAEEVRRLASAAVASGSEVIDRLQVSAPTEVTLKVRIAEVDHTVVKDLGVNWDTVVHPGQFVFGVASGNPVLSSTGTAAAASAASTIITRNTGSNGSATDSIIAGFNAGGTLIDSVIDALDQNGLVNMLAEPTLTATSGQTASFLAGGEFPMIVPSGTASTFATVEFKSYGVSLSFTPVILANGRISLRVAPEVSQLTTQGAITVSGISIPALTTRRAETTVELGSGQSFAIGGLLENSVNNTANGLPGLGTLPVLGPLFRSQAFQHNESELVIIVTPYLVKPAASADQLAAPTDGYVPPNDTDLLLKGLDTHPATAGAAPSAAATTSEGADSGSSRLVGPAGFVLN